MFETIREGGAGKVREGRRPLEKLLIQNVGNGFHVLLSRNGVGSGGGGGEEEQGKKFTNQPRRSSVLSRRAKKITKFCEGGGGCPRDRR